MKKVLVLFFSLLICVSLAQTSAYENAKNLYSKGKLHEAIETCTSEIKKLNSSSPEFKKLMRLRADCHMESRSFKQAIEDLKKLIKLDSKEISNYLAISFAYWETDEEENCLDNLQKAYQLNPKDAGTLSNMSYYYGQGGKYQESIKYSNIGLEQNPAPVLKGVILNNRGYAYICLKEYEKALTDINQSIELYPNNALAYCYRAMANIALQRMHSVCPDLAKAKNLGAEKAAKDLIMKYCMQ